MDSKKIVYKPSVPVNNNENKGFKFLGLLILLICVAAISFAGGRMFEDKQVGLPFGDNNFTFLSGQGDNTKSENVDMDMFWSVWNTLKDNYVDSKAADENSMYYGAIKGMVNSYNDPATIYLTPEETAEFSKQNEGKLFEGIGAELGYENGLIVVISPIEGSPAKAAGLKPGDVILKIDSQEIKPSESIFDVVKKIRGEAGTDVVLSVISKGETSVKDITIKRGEITVPSITFSESSEEGVYIIDIGRFTDASVAAWVKNWNDSVDDFIRSGSKKLILDLRGNPGGFFDAGIYAAEEFLPKETIVTKQEDRNGKITEYKVTREGRLQDVDVVVLVNDGSASASEILAGALQKNDRAEIIGVGTYGKGTAQSVINLSDGSSLHITILKWLLPDGTWINKENVIKPDYIVDLTDEDFKEGRDPQMDKAIEVVK